MQTTKDMSQVITVLEDVKYRVERENPQATEELKATKVINIMKEKRNSKKNAGIKADYQSMVDILEDNLRMAREAANKAKSLEPVPMSL